MEISKEQGGELMSNLKSDKILVNKRIINGIKRTRNGIIEVWVVSS